jgi:glycosyltransferase involved in cell wall biosynthesis
LRISWITNSAAPYRLPVWEAIGAENDLEVVLLENDKRFLADRGNRGSDWVAGDKAHAFRMRQAETKRVRRGEADYFFARGTSVLGPIRPDVVLLGGWESPAYFSTLRRAKSLSIPTVGFYESTLHSQRFSSGPISAARAWFFRHLDAVVVPGVAAADALRAMGVSEQRIHVGFNSVDVDMFARLASDSRTSSTLPTIGHRYIFVGQLIDRKNPLGLLDAFNDVSQPGDSLTFVGEGALEADLRARCGPDSNLIGSVPYAELPFTLSGHHTLVMPSHSEVWGLVANEALAAGLNVVVSDVSGVAPSIEAMNGVFVTATSRTELGAALSRSRAEWDGPRDSPEILRHGPSEFAGVFLDAFKSVVER